jgi:hypothetical protein
MAFAECYPSGTATVAEVFRMCLKVATVADFVKDSRNGM